MPDHVNPQTGTTMGAAFTAAGYEPPYERLRRLMREAIEEAGKGIFEPVADRFIAKLLEEDTRVMWELFAEERMGRCRALFTEVLVDMKRQQEPKKKPSSEPVATRPTPQPESHPEPLIVISRKLDAQVKPDSRHGTYVKYGFEHSSPPPAVAPPPQRRHRPVEAMDAVAEVSRVNWLRRTVINGKPLGEVTVREAREWCASQGHRVRFILLLIEGLTDDRIIGEARSPEDAARAYELALHKMAA